MESKKLIQITSAIAVVAAMLLCSSNLFAGMMPLYDDSFETGEGYTVDTTIIGTNGWALGTWGTQTYAEVRDVIPTDGSNTLRFSGSTTGNAAIYKTFAAEEVTGIIELEIDMRTTSATYAEFALGDSSMTFASADAGAGVGAQFGFNNGTQFRAWNGSTCYYAGTPASGTFYTFHAIIDPVANLYSLEVLDQSTGATKVAFDGWGTGVTHDYGDGYGTLKAFEFRKEITGIQNMLFRGSMGANTPMYVDNIQMTTEAAEVPEPSTVALILTSLLALGFCRKLKK